MAMVKRGPPVVGGVEQQQQRLPQLLAMAGLEENDDDCDSSPSRWQWLPQLLAGGGKKRQG
jgi:hypothetical protein